MTRRARLAATAAGLVAGLAVTAVPAGAYELAARPGGGVLVTEEVGRSLALDVARVAPDVVFTPAADGLGGVPGCTSTDEQTACDASSGVGTALAVSASQLTLRLTGVQTGTLEVLGGAETDVVRATALAVSGAVALTTGDGDDVVELAGAVGTLSEASTQGDDRYVLDLPGLGGSLALGDGNDVVLARRTTLALDGGGDADVLESGGALDGGAGDGDVLRPVTAGQSVAGGAGSGDRVTFGALPDGPAGPPDLLLQVTAPGQVAVGGGAPSVTGVEEVEGGRGADVLVGRAGATDRLFGGPGADRLRGAGGGPGPGNGDVLDGGTGPDTASYEDVGAAVVVDLAARTGGPAGVTDQLVSVDRLVGGGGDDELRGDDAANRIEGGAGRDLLEGRGGDDVLLGGAGPAVLRGGDGVDELESDQAAPFADVLDGGDGGDALRAGPGDDVLQGGRGTDALDGGLGRDTASWAERLGFEPVGVTLAGGVDDGAAGEADALTGVEDALGGAGNDRLVGDDGANRLDGGPGDDTVLGLRGGDELAGGPGDDALDAFDLLPDSVDCGDGGADRADADAADAVGGCEQVSRISANTDDADKDQVAVPLDCDDRNPAIRPGAADVPGNGVDEDCSGADAAFPRVLAVLRSQFDATTRGTRIVRLTATNIDAATTVRVTCVRANGGTRGCPFKRRTSRPARGTTYVRLQPLFGRRQLPGGLRFEVRVTRPGAIGRVVTFTTRPRARRPVVQPETCLPPGATRPTACPR